MTPLPELEADVARAENLDAASCLNPRRGNASFSLVEVTLALMVISVGMLGVLSLFTVGVEQNRRGTEATHAMLFAQQVFAQLMAEASNVISPTDAWDAIGSLAWPAPVDDNLWVNPSDIRVTGVDIVTNRYDPVQLVTGIVFRYRLTLLTNGNIKQVSLEVWPGEFGALSNQTIFYTEFLRQPGVSL